MFLLLVSNVLVAQDDYGFYLQKARQRIAEGDCEGAQRNYNVYKDLAKKTDKSIERMLADCGTSNPNENPLKVEELKASGFRFLKHNNKVTVTNQSDYQETIITNVSPSYLRDRKFIDGMLYYGGKVSNKGLLNGVVVIKGNDASRYLAYICEGKIAYPILEIGFYDGGLFMSLQEGCYSYGCIFPSWGGHYRSDGLCESMREVYGVDFSDPIVLREIFNSSVDLNMFENAFRQFVTTGKKLDDSWSDDPEYTTDYEGLKPLVEGYMPGVFPDLPENPRDDGLLYSQTSEYYCDGIYAPDEPADKNGHAFHTPDLNINPRHFRVIFSFKAVSNKGPDGKTDKQWPIMLSRGCRFMGVCLYEDGTINITTNIHHPKFRDHYYVTGWNYSTDKYVYIDMEYDHGRFIINGHQFDIDMDTITDDCDYSFHSVNYARGDAFKGYIKGVKIYSYSD
jgi:hypothetical protein